LRLRAASRWRPIRITLQNPNSIIAATWRMAGKNATFVVPPVNPRIAPSILLRPVAFAVIEVERPAGMTAGFFAQFRGTRLPFYLLQVVEALLSCILDGSRNRHRTGQPTPAKRSVSPPVTPRPGTRSNAASRPIGLDQQLRSAAGHRARIRHLLSCRSQ
jgi:hypothetical protein